MISNQYFCCHITRNINFTLRNILTSFLVYSRKKLTLPCIILPFILYFCKRI